MKTALASLALFLLAGAIARAEPTLASPPEHTIPNSQLWKFAGNPDGRPYRLHVSVPSSYYKDTSKRYPVVYVTDAYWDFVKIAAIRGSLVYDKVAPEFIVVGFGYAGENLDYGNLRRWELSPVQFG